MTLRCSLPFITLKGSALHCTLCQALGLHRPSFQGIPWDIELRLKERLDIQKKGIEKTV